ncbi:MAG: hypothetical protein II793_00665, partial [Bacteroidales bacterium]|nr:hypothetical protein [Bacteroidales bacterium]
MSRTSGYRLLLLLGLVSLCLAGMLSLASCGGESNADSVRISRFERLMLDTPDEALVDALTQFREEHPTPLLRISLTDERYMDLVSDYRADNVMRMVDDTVQRYFSDLSWLKKDLDNALGRAWKMDSTVSYNDVITSIMGGSYASRVAADRDSRSIVIS